MLQDSCETHQDDDGLETEEDSQNQSDEVEYEDDDDEEDEEYIATKLKQRSYSDDDSDDDDYDDSKQLQTCTTLAECIEQGFLNSLEELIACGHSVNQPNECGTTPLMLAVCEGHDDVVKLLLDNQADINQKDINGFTALHEAVWACNSELTQFLLKNNADVDAANEEHHTPLIAAANEGIGYEDIVQILLDFGADTTIESPFTDGRPGQGNAAEHADTNNIREIIEKFKYQWHVKRHYKAPKSIKQVVSTTTMIRSLVPEVPLSLLPNELLFSIFEWL